MIEVLLNSNNIKKDIKNIIKIDKIIKFNTYYSNYKIDKVFTDYLESLLYKSIFYIYNYFNITYLSNLNDIDDLNSTFLQQEITNDIYNEIFGEYFNYNANNNLINDVYYTCLNDMIKIYINIIKFNIIEINTEHNEGREIDFDRFE